MTKKAKDFYLSMPNIISAIAALMFAFIALHQLVDAEVTFVFDRSVLNYVAQWHEYLKVSQFPWLIEVARDITALGSVHVLLLISLIFVSYFLISNQKRSAIILSIAYVASLISSYILKEVVERPRPDIIGGVPAVYSTSFPSAHALQSIAVFLTISLLLASSQTRYPLKVCLCCLGLTVSFLVGVSRVLLGVHWPTDVIAGWLVGIALALAMSLLTQIWVGIEKR